MSNNIDKINDMLKSLNLSSFNPYYHAQIYKIVSPNTTSIYIGSTIKPLKRRLSRHKSKKDCKARYIIDAGDCKIELIEFYPCETEEELLDREDYYINKYKNICINSRSNCLNIDSIDDYNVCISEAIKTDTIGYRWRCPYCKSRDDKFIRFESQFDLKKHLKSKKHKLNRCKSLKTIKKKN
jgi:predicted GIY-YIG superfamily endonuclease